MTKIKEGSLVVFKPLSEINDMSSLGLGIDAFPQDDSIYIVSSVSTSDMCIRIKNQNERAQNKITDWCFYSIKWFDLYIPCGKRETLE